MRTVVLAGGMGTRLLPYTSVLPKPLLPLGDRSILEILMNQLAAQGFVDITLSVGHLAHLIEAVLSNGLGRTIRISYVREDVPLGTAGSLRLVSGLSNTFLMLNGDLVTTLDYRELVRHHRTEGNILTIATRRREVRTEYGVLTISGDGKKSQRISQYQEKPIFDFLVSMGIYVLEPEALDYIPHEGYFDFPELVQRLLDAGARIGSYEFDGLWLDIGRHEDYEKAIAMWERGELTSVFTPSSPPAPLRAAEGS